MREVAANIIQIKKSAYLSSHNSMFPHTKVEIPLRNLKYHRHTKGVFCISIFIYLRHAYQTNLSDTVHKPNSPFSCPSPSVPLKLCLLSILLAIVLVTLLRSADASKVLPFPIPCRCGSTAMRERTGLCTQLVHLTSLVQRRETEYVVNQFNMSMSVCKQQCTLLKHTLFYKHCDPSIQGHWYVTITHGTKI
jgi:hypothetical protein